MSKDGELEAMEQLVAALRGLDEEAVARVLKWASDRFKVTSRKLPTISGGEDISPKAFNDLPSLFHVASPSTEAEKVLIVGYWLQELQGKDSLDAFTVNSQLKHLGYGVGNVTKAFDALKNANPRLAIQLEKSGQARQARKKLKITVAGVQRVQDMIQKSNQQESN